MARARRGRRRRIMPCSGKSLSPRPLLLALSSFNRLHQNHNQTILTITSPPTTGHALRPALTAIASNSGPSPSEPCTPASARGRFAPVFAGNPSPSTALSYHRPASPAPPHAKPTPHPLPAAGSAISSDCQIDRRPAIVGCSLVAATFPYLYVPL